ncbi:MAG: hypothetical protein HYR94_12375, partial [Chloroflexi bacterium]|nr:hypothetical protein [Chloroflexota bacterium]
MNPKELWVRFTSSPPSIKLALVAVIVIWTIASLMFIFTMIFFYLEQSGQALEPTPGVAEPVVALEPASGSPGTLVTVRGEGWPADNTVLIFLRRPDEPDLPPFAVAGGIIGSEGRFTTGFIFPTEPRWQGQNQAIVLARVETSSVAAQAIFDLTGQEPPLMETVTSPPESSPTPVETVGPVPSGTQGPGGFVEPTATPTTVWNVRFGLTRWEDFAGNLIGRGYDPRQLGFPDSLVRQFKVLQF